MRRLARLLAAGACVLGASCVHYTSVPPERSPEFLSAHGRDGVATMRTGETMAGELLFVTDTAIYVAMPEPVMISYELIDWLRFGEFYWYPSREKRPNASTLARGRRMSRYPLPLADTVMARLLRERTAATRDSTPRTPP